jgi:predicted outer membrane repeat protein
MLMSTRCSVLCVCTATQTFLLLLRQGGAVSADVFSTVNISSTKFAVCSAIIGGAIQSAGNSTLLNATFDSSTAEQNGGALYSTATGVITAAKCTFTNNKVH